MKKIFISTTYKGYNFGTSLQAYSSKKNLINLGYDAQIIGYESSLVKGRNIRIGKIFNMFCKTVWRPSLFKDTFLVYNNNLKKEVKIRKKELFLEFQKNKIDALETSWGNLKELSKESIVLACLCGSDQIWNASNVYIDPIYFLRFAPQNKRLAYAPSFGKDFIAYYNKNTMKKYIGEIPNISVREEQGAVILEELIEKNVPVVLDPTLLITKDEWKEEVKEIELVKEKYILFYFLDEPTEETIKNLMSIYEKMNCKVISISGGNKGLESFNIKALDEIGPLEFISLISNASFVCTDSFHGMAFSINLNIPFYIFKRNYGKAIDQSSRIISLLEKLESPERYINSNMNIGNLEMSYKKENILLDIERKKSQDYIKNSLESIRGKTNG